MVDLTSKDHLNLGIASAPIGRADATQPKVAPMNLGTLAWCASKVRDRCGCNSDGTREDQ